MKYLLTELGQAGRHCALFVRHDLEPNVFPFGPPTQSISAYIEDITRWREDTNFVFEWQTQYLTRSLRSLVRYCVCHENIKFISSRQRVMFFLLNGDKTSEIAHFYSLLVASVEKFFENLQIVQGLLFCVFVVEAFGKLFHLFIV